MIYPWHRNAWRKLAEHWQQQPNAWLLAGRENTGKTEFARSLAQALLCEKPQADHSACGHCPSCHLFEQDSHPDFYLLEPDQTEGESGARRLQQIKIDAVRAILEPLTHSSLRGNRRVVMIAPAESMNLQAANALLKMLEEPPEAVVFLLVSHQRDRLLPTIRSRCRQLPLPLPTHEQALAFLRERRGGSEEAAEAELAFHGGAPLFDEPEDWAPLRRQLLDFLAAPRLLAALDYAAEFDRHKQPLALLLEWLHKWLADMALAQHRLPPLYYPARADALSAAAGKTAPDGLFGFADQLNRLLPYGRHSLNVRLQTEALLSEYLMLFQRKKR